VQFADVRIRPFGPLVAALGGIGSIIAGSAVMTGRIRARQLGARYERGTHTPAAAPTSEDPALQMWKELDGHRDPTLDPPAPTGRDRVDRAPDDGSSRGEPAL
jgi:hypothetical protein